MLMLNERSQRGVTLIEMMIGLVVGMIVVAAVIAIYVSTLRGGNHTLRTARLNQELRATMDVMVRDIRRAGFNGWNTAGTIVLSTDNNFAKQGAGGFQTDLRIFNLVAGPPIEDCILFAYDLANWGTVDAAEYMGFKLANGAVRMRRSGSTTNSADCSDGEPNNWENITDPNTITVTALSFTTVGSQCVNFGPGGNGIWKITDANTQTAACDAAAGNVVAVRGAFAVPVAGDKLIEARQIRITLTGQVAADTTIRATLTEEVQVRNDRIYNKP